MNFKVLIAFLFSVLSCSAYELKPCDLLFVTSGVSDFSEAITRSTSRGDSLSFTHVAMVYSCGDSLRVIEADPENGVRTLELNRFLAQCPTVNNLPGVVAMRLEIDFDKPQTVTNALSFVGQPYDWYYLPENGMMYCSELIYESYIDKTGKRVFNDAPMNFKAADGTIPAFWLDLYSKLGMDVPQGQPGTNPNDMARQPGLIEIHRFF